MSKFTTMKKTTIASVITIILILWDVIAPSLEIIAGVGSKGFAIASLTITALSYIYDFFYPEESLFKTMGKLIKNF